MLLLSEKIFPAGFPVNIWVGDSLYLWERARERARSVEEKEIENRGPFAKPSPQPSPNGRGRSRGFLRPGDREDMHAHAGLITFKRWHRAAEVAGG